MDGVVVVLHAGETRKAAVHSAMELLRRAHARILGVVLNHVRAQKGGYEYSFQYYYHNYSESYYAADDVLLPVAGIVAVLSWGSFRPWMRPRLWSATPRD